MTGNRLGQLTRLGQSIWYDYIRRDLYDGPALRRLIEEDGLTGMTSNPTIFERTITQTDLYDQEILQLAAQRRKPAEILDVVALHDVRRAAGRPCARDDPAKDHQAHHLQGLPGAGVKRDAAILDQERQDGHLAMHKGSVLRGLGRPAKRVSRKRA